jgi:phosphoribosylanthranilate isomerase
VTERPRVKICGVTIAADALAVSACGADYLGLNLWPGSKRHVPLAHATRLAALMRSTPHVKLVGLFVNAELADIVAAAEAMRLDVVQLHGDETPHDCAIVATATGARVWKAIGVRTVEDVEALDRWPVDAIVLDAPSPARGGTGTRCDWGLARRAVSANLGRKIVLAGGLSPDDVTTAISEVGPWGVDVASGVELQPGIKDHAKIKAFVAAARGHR